MEEAKEELCAVMSDDRMKDAALLVLANKQDLPQSLSPAEVMEKLELSKLFRSSEFMCQGCVGTQGQGLYEGMDWLAGVLNKRPSAQSRSSTPLGYS